MNLRKQIEAAALEAGKIILSADSIQAATDEKSGHANFVTEYDKKVQEFLGSIIFLVGLTMTHYRFAMPAASLDMNLRQCMRTFTPTAKNSGTACFLRRRDQAS